MTRFRIFLTLIALASGLASCSGAGSPTPTVLERSAESPIKRTLATISDYSQLVDPSLPAVDKTKVVSILKTLNLSTAELGSSWENTTFIIIDTRDNTITSNVAGLARFVTVKNTLGPEEPKRSAYVDPISTTTGPSRRIWTHPKSASQYPADTSPTFAIADVAVPCGNSQNVAGDQGDIYFGGDSATGSMQIDAGLQDDRSASHPDVYELFLRLGSTEVGAYLNDGGSGYWNQLAPKVYLQCGGTARLEFDLERATGGNDNTTFIVNFLSQALQKVNFVYIAGNQNGTYNGWSPNCDGCQLKRVTSIATGNTSKLSDHDTFQTTWSNITLSCGFSIFSDSCVEEEPWGANETAVCDEFPWWGSGPGQADCYANPAVSNVVQVPQFNYSSESVNIANIQPTPLAKSIDSGWIQSTTPGVSYAFHLENDGVNGISASATLKNANSAPVNLILASSCPVEFNVIGSVYNANGQYQGYYPIYTYPGPETTCAQSYSSVALSPNATVAIGSISVPGNHTDVIGIGIYLNGIGICRSSEAECYGPNNLTVGLASASPAWSGQLPAPLQVIHSAPHRPCEPADSPVDPTCTGVPKK